MMGFEEVIGWEYSYGQVGINSTILKKNFCKMFNFGAWSISAY